MIVDPTWYGGEEAETYVALSSLRTAAAEWAEIDGRSRRLVSDLTARFSGAETVAVFGTGPSMTSIDPKSLGADAIVACNSAISNRRWMASADPAVVTFGDAVFHFGPITIRCRSAPTCSGCRRDGRLVRYSSSICPPACPQDAAYRRSTPLHSVPLERQE